MVCKIFDILDENEIKKLPKVDYTMVKLKYYDYCMRVLKSFSEYIEHTIIDDDLNERTEIILNPNYIEPHGKMLKFRDKYCEQKSGLGYNTSWWSLKIDWIAPGCFEHEIEATFQKHFSLQNLLDYLGIIPFTPSVMINISPDWKDKRCNGTKVKMLKHIIDSYMQEEWYDKWEYVIENGSDGTHIHAHIVAHMNVNRLKSTESHLRKGNHSQQLRKYASKLKGMEGTIKGTSIQKIFLRNEELVKDKLLYLHEETKPPGHKNKSVIDGGYITGCL